ncbi:DivIVA domain-containing protein [[Mycoplasma] gypis]|uniref:DivIVA domain-containing protein n=1 Tax=[Mycoplasma] gypis TaxID=92404 RepID=A0ABZ2RR32_9BACT|nr:DivIVA domain-containing protein [[Mycoplasma] gypis]MBN0919288.1 DivIVA domain-containing protein [[Mycoplasma] gypis]
MPKVSVDQIYKKKFSASLNGYNPEEVDEFLDLLLNDIKEYQYQIEILKSKIKE